MPAHTRPATYGQCANFMAVDMQMTCELSREAPSAPFIASLFRIETRWFNDDERPDTIETRVCEARFDSSVPAIFVAVDAWLIDKHRLRVPAPSWRHGHTGPEQDWCFS